MSEIVNKNCIIKNIFKRESKKYTIQNNYIKYIESIEKDIADGKNICVVTLCKKIGLDIRDAMKKKFPEIANANQIVCLHSDSDDQHKKEMQDVNKNWAKYRLIIYTPIVGPGINFSVIDHFDKIYGYVIGNVESPRIFLQMLGRVRNSKCHDIIVGIYPKMNKNTRAQLYSLDKNYCHSVIHKDYDGIKKISKNEHGKKHIEKDPSDNLWNTFRAYYIQEKLNSTNYNFLTMLKIMVEGNGDVFETNFDF